MTDRTVELNEMISNARLLREHYLSDPYRPGYHFVVPEGVHAPVDPNGAIFYHGRYHLCYIYQHEGKHYWGHISSTDLLHWRHHPPALAPGDGDDGIFSGGAFIDDDDTVIYSYWGLRKPDGICLASSNDPLLEKWQKNPANPLIIADDWGWTEKDGQIYGAADPSQIWKKDGRYYLLTGNLLVLKEFGEKRGMPEHLGDTLYLFDSLDLTHWRYLHQFYQSNRAWTKDFEDDMCPDFFPLPTSPEGGEASDTHMILFISHSLGCQYYLGKYHDDRFTPEQHGRMTWIDNAFFAPESLADQQGRRIMWSWIFDQRTQESKEKSGWSGELSLPRLLWAAKDGTLGMKPIPELANLRYNEQPAQELFIDADSELVVPEISGTSLEISLIINPGESTSCGIKVCIAADNSEETIISYNSEAQTISIDTSKSSLGEGTKVIEAAPFSLAEGELLKLTIFIDKSIVELFANDRQAIMRRIYPTLSSSQGIALFSNGAGMKATITGWQMMESNPY